MPARLKRQIVSYPTREAPGTVIIDTPNTYLYYVLGGGQAIRYGIGVGRDGFTWSGVQSVTKKAEWPDWTPPPEMIARQPYLPRHMAGGPGNPLGARAMYLGGTVYRIHGTNAPETIGTHVSSGCIRLTNADVSRPLFAGQCRHQGDRDADGPARGKHRAGAASASCIGKRDQGTVRARNGVDVRAISISGRQQAGPDRSSAAVVNRDRIPQTTATVAC